MRYYKLTISMPEEDGELLHSMAEERRKTRSCVIREALHLMNDLSQERRAGRHVGSADDRDALKMVIGGSI